MNRGKKYILTPERESFLRKYYAELGAQECMKHVLFRGLPDWRIYDWARDLGVARSNHREWTQEEELYLESHYHWLTSAEIARKLDRSVAEINHKCRLLGVRKYGAGYTLQEVAEGLGCGDKTIARWIANKWLRANRRGTERDDDRAAWYISDQAIRDFVRNHANKLNQHKFDWLWLVDILLKNGLGELASQREVSRDEENNQTTIQEDVNRST